MCPGCRSATLAGVNRPVMIQLELHPVGNSVRGCAIEPSGAAREFTGFMGMVAAIDALLREAEAQPGSPEDLP